MYNPLIKSFKDLSDSQLSEKIRDITQKYYQTSNITLRYQLSDILEELVQEQSSRLLDKNISNESFDTLININ